MYVANKFTEYAIVKIRLFLFTRTRVQTLSCVLYRRFIIAFRIEDSLDDNSGAHEYRFLQQSGIRHGNETAALFPSESSFRG